jgi:hypothetical protein
MQIRTFFYFFSASLAFFFARQSIVGLGKSAKFRQNKFKNNQPPIFSRRLKNKLDFSTVLFI